MSATVINFNEVKMQRKRTAERGKPCFEEEQLKSANKQKLSVDDRQMMAQNLSSIIDLHKKMDPSFKEIALHPFIAKYKSKFTEADFYRFKHRITLLNDVKDKPLSANPNDYIYFVEALIFHCNKKAKLVYERLTQGTRFHATYKNKGAALDSKQRAAVIYRRFMKEVKRLDETHHILDAYREINELVIKDLNRGIFNVWPENEWIKADVQPNYNVMLSDIGFSKSLLKRHFSGDMCIQYADVEEFIPEEQQMIVDAIKKYISEPELQMEEIKKPMSLYHYCAPEPMQEPENILRMPRFYIGLLEWGNHSTWKEAKKMLGGPKLQQFINKPILTFEELWDFLFIYPSPDGESLQLRLHCGSFGFEEVNEDMLSRYLPLQLFPPNVRWRDNQLPGSFEEFLMDENNFQAIIQSLEDTVADLKNHPLLIAKRNIQKATIAYIEKLESE